MQVSLEDGVVRPSEKAPSGKKSKLICVGIGITCTVYTSIYTSVVPMGHCM